MHRCALTLALALGLALPAVHAFVPLAGTAPAGTATRPLPRDAPRLWVPCRSARRALFDAARPPAPCALT